MSVNRTRLAKLETIHKAKAAPSFDAEKTKAWLENIIQAIIDDQNQQIANQAPCISGEKHG
jgi:hypothetical protein